MLFFLITQAFKHSLLVDFDFLRERHLAFVLDALFPRCHRVQLFDALRMLLGAFDLLNVTLTDSERAPVATKVFTQVWRLVYGVLELNIA